MKHFFVAACLLIIQSAAGQKIVKDHYTVSGGLLGAANFSKFRISGNDNLDYSTKFGWGAGGWVNFPLGKVISLEPQLMYNSYTYSSDVTGALLRDGKANYFSIPVLLKFHLGKNFAITAGPQFDFLTGIDDNLNINKKEDITSSSIAINAGIEIVPHARVVPFVRYIHGLTNMDNTGNPNTVGDFYNQNIQAGLKLRLFGKHILADSDGDGFNDKVDKCPSVVGLERYQGCPIPDTDNDGINDEEDRCPDVAGVAEMMGCPAIDYQAHEVLFQSGKATLMPAGKKELDNLVNFLNKNPNVKITLEGHTDNSGTDKINDPLSVKRAESAEAYLVSKGIDESRIATAGYGSKQPIADNKTKEGKAKNRRIELKVQ
jgi:outer membrane protein OmpA-like peptidoglycan-associated protein